MNKIKFDIIMQGPYSDITEEIIQNYLKLDFVDKIIFSTWEDSKLFWFKNFGPRVKVIFNKDVEYPGVGNINRQLRGSLVGLKHSNSEFAIRMRPDTFWSLDCFKNCYDFFCQRYNKNLLKKLDGTNPKSKIFCIGLNTIWPFGNDGMWPFGVPDMMFWSSRDELIDLYGIPFLMEIENKPYGDFTRHMSAESYLASSYFAKYDERIKYFCENREEALYHKSKYNKEAYELYLKYSTKIFKPFPHSYLDLYWPKKLKNEKYDFTESKKMFGIINHEDDPYEQIIWVMNLSIFIFKYFFLLFYKILI